MSLCFSSHLDPYCDPCHDLVYGSNSSMIEGSFSIVSVLAHEQVIAEQRKTLMINMTRNRIPKAMHKQSNQGGLTPIQSVQTDSASEKTKKVQNVQFDKWPGLLHILALRVAKNGLENSINLGGNAHCVYMMRMLEKIYSRQSKSKTKIKIGLKIQ